MSSPIGRAIEHLQQARDIVTRDIDMVAAITGDLEGEMNQHLRAAGELFARSAAPLIRQADNDVAALVGTLMTLYQRMEGWEQNLVGGG